MFYVHDANKLKKKILKLTSKKLYYLMAVSGFLIDRISKIIIRDTMDIGSSVSVIGNFFHLTHITNTGIAFGMARGNNTFFILLSVAILSMLIYFFVKTEKSRELLPLVLIAAGAAGNLYDRMIYGSVCDFLEFNLGFPPFNPWPIFNVADAMITVGGIILFYIEFVHKPNLNSTK